MRVCRYHCPMSHAMRDWEKGSRNLADLESVAGSLATEPGSWCSAWPLIGRESSRDLDTGLSLVLSPSRARCLSRDARLGPVVGGVPRLIMSNLTTH